VTKVGGSLSGLIHGVLLKRGGHNIRILERNSTLLVSSQGAGLNAGPDVQQFMREFDRTGLPYSLNPPTAQFMDSVGKVIRTMESDQRSTDWSTLYYRLRANFDGLQTGYCEVPPGTERDGQALYMDGHSVSEVKYQHGHLTVEFHCPDGSIGSIDADLVIAADGPSSKVRQIMAPEVERKYVGYCGWRGTIPEYDLSEEAKTILNENITVCGIEKSFLTSFVLELITLILNVYM
jgi:2-polyprenyl-6-methoxyphenol hydroxylase-like FAD-dependent oxidoreductase